MATVQHSRPAPAWNCSRPSACAADTFPHPHRRSQWLVDPELKATDTILSFEFVAFAFSVFVMLGGLLWHSGRIDGLVRIVTTLAQKLTA